MEPIRQQLFSYNLNGEFSREIAPARTFVTIQEAEALRSRGLGTHLQPGDVLGLDGPLGAGKATIAKSVCRCAPKT